MSEFEEKILDRIEYLKTEQAAIDEEREEMVRQQEFSIHMGSYVKRMNHLLEIATTESRLQLRDMFLNEAFFTNYKQVELFAVMHNVMSIYEAEYGAGIENTILEQGKTTEDFLNYYFELKMLLYRMDFDYSLETEEELIVFLLERNVSTVALPYWLNTTAIRTQQLALKLIDAFEKRNMYSFLLVALSYIEEKWGGNYKVLIKLFEIYSAVGRDERAMEYMKRIPSEFMMLHRTNANLIKAQELVWRVYYEDENADIELVYFLRQGGITGWQWKTLLQMMKNEKNAECLCLLERLLEV